MRYQIAILLLAAFCLMASAPTKAQWYEGEKWEVTPFGGFETSGSFPIVPTQSLDPTLPTIDRLRVNSSASFGTFVDYSLSENLQAEFMWNRNNTSFSEHDFDTNTYSKAFNSDIDQYQFGLLYMLRNNEHKLRPFIAGGIGFTHESNEGADNPNRTLLSFGLGGGVKYTVTRHIGLRGDIRWLPTRANSTPGLTCDFFGNCFQVNQPNYLERVNFTGGVIFRF